MGDAAEDRTKAAQLPEGDVILILLEQHARIRELFADVKSAEGERKQHAFDELRALLAVHETAEEMVLRPVSRDAAGASVTKQILAAEKIAPTHRHPSAAGSVTAQYAMGPFASLVDRTRDAIKAALQDRPTREERQ